MAGLRTDYTPGETGHAAIHNATNTAVNALSADTGWVNIAGVVTLGTGFAAGDTFSVTARRFGEFVSINVTGIIKAAGVPVLSIPVTGNVENTVILENIPSQYRPTTSGGRALGPGSLGRVNSYGIYSDGAIRLTAMTPSATQTSSADCPSGEGFSCSGTYLI